MITNWNRVIIGDESTYPPLNRPILWNSYWGSIKRRKTLETLAYISHGEHFADGTLIKNGDCWAELPNIE